MDFVLSIKLATVFLFLIMFLRGTRLYWGIGLITVTTAVLLDTFLTIFGRDEMLAMIGSFIYIINGALFTGGLLWLWGLLRPLQRQSASDSMPVTPTARPLVGGRSAINRATPAEATRQRTGKERAHNVDTVFDRQMLYEQMRYRLGPDDLRNLIFDLAMNENDVVGLNQDASSMILNLMDLAEERGQGGQLALAVERILAPLPVESLPRAEKISEDSPPTVLRHYLLGHYAQADLVVLAGKLGIEWDDLPGDSRQSKTRELLLHLRRRNRLPNLVDQIRSDAADNQPAATHRDQDES
jgi:hypothetical protein